MLLIWFVGGVTRFMNVLQSSGSFGWNQNLLRQVLVILLPFTTSSGSVQFLSITATKADFTQLIQDHYLMSRMDYCFITSKMPFSLLQFPSFLLLLSALANDLRVLRFIVAISCFLFNLLQDYCN